MLAEFIVTAYLLFVAANGAEEGVVFRYGEQEAWTGVCVNGNTGRQSPINIVAADAEESSILTDLRLGAGWTTPITGTFKNGGANQNVQFDPTNTTNPKVITTNYLGDYLVIQMHMHWGANNREGSEHTLNGMRYPLELHFVHTKLRPAADATDGDYLAVIGVFAQVDENMPISGVWAQLDVSAIQTYDSQKIPITDFMYKSLLPSSLDYYHYNGSLTTPPCSEVVQWFVLKEPITVPGAYLDNLRRVQSDNETTVTLNFRRVQLLNERTVFTFDSESGSPKIVASVLSILIAMFVTVYFS